ncbi:hypothetical protein CAOG_03457 [Capsaspora owczarzaki ATCC 30864]|uniref:C2H2-type domain-containing protein n=1 Tax=Capsaspora owczarzaki (strain ATCC 30864) TaxID=595528 RepID=A0A0D2UBU7_CAPO3|nr:hypothetical protein CAOG_03457 [Capsaspora owczarzaki ATCC 30864]KJE92501.1 hypothetical protein CAOG_003457 [Capsaspora owczarzaki ATCC 30864]|eukprot:XP_004364296.2 hypothetical protein CAOG_03457 [Capsaspora owczarzaki ATCC 30864]
MPLTALPLIGVERVEQTARFASTADGRLSLEQEALRRIKEKNDVPQSSMEVEPSDAHKQETNISNHKLHHDANYRTWRQERCERWIRGDTADGWTSPADQDEHEEEPSTTPLLLDQVASSRHSTMSSPSSEGQHQLSAVSSVSSSSVSSFRTSPPPVHRVVQLQLDDHVEELTVLGESDQIFKCDNCGKIYKQRNSLHKHMWEHNEHWHSTSQHFNMKKHQQVLAMQAAMQLVSIASNDSECEWTTRFPNVRF